jgi:tRNA-dihydrouridine synthase C
MQAVLLDYFDQIVADKVRGYVHGRLKQWLHQLKKHYPKPRRCSAGSRCCVMSNPFVSCCSNTVRLPDLRQLLLEHRAAA